MADDQTTTQGQGTGTITSDGAIVVDKNKSAEQYLKEAEKKYIIPALVREKFPDLIKLTFETESMNAEEREYWMQILAIMTEDQIVKYREILVNEKNQLAKLDQDYQGEMARINKTSNPIDEAALHQKMQKIKQAEAATEKKEEATEEQLLKQLGEM